MKFLIVIGKDALYTYSTIGQDIQPQYIEGSEAFSYNANSIGEEIESYLEALANEKNLGTVSKLEFDVLEGSNKLVNHSMYNSLKEYIDQWWKFDEAVANSLKILSKDKKLYIKEFGINYDGRSYRLEQDRLMQDDYDLLAYSVHYKEMAELLNVKIK
mgnify:CR=1 FL=1